MHGRCGGTTIRTVHTRNAQQRGVTLEEASEVVHEGLRHEVDQHRTTFGMDAEKKDAGRLGDRILREAGVQ